MQTPPKYVHFHINICECLERGLKRHLQTSSCGYLRGGEWKQELTQGGSQYASVLFDSFTV